MRIFVLISLIFSMLALPQLANAATRSEVVPLDRIVAIVDDNVITQIELDQRVKSIIQQLKEKNTRLPSMEDIRRQILERLVIEKIQLQLAERLGIRINDEMVNRVIANIASENKLSMEEFRKVLKKDNYDFADFRENIRREVTITRLRKLRVENKVQINQQEIDNFLDAFKKDRSANNEYRLSHILIAIPEAATPDQVEKAEQKAKNLHQELLSGADFGQLAVAESNDELALKAGDLGWRKTAQLPSLFSSLVVDMKKGGIIGPLRSASGFHIIKLMDKRSNEQRRIIEQTMTRHILITPTQILNDNQVKQRLKQLRERILAGEDFATLARANSADKGSAAEGGSLGWVNPNSMVPRFEEEMQKLKPGEISEPFRTQYGWHIVQVLSRRKHDNTAEFLSSQAHQLIRKRKTEEAVQDWLRRLRAEAYVEYRINQ